MDLAAVGWAQTVNASRSRQMLFRLLITCATAAVCEPMACFRAPSANQQRRLWCCNTLTLPAEVRSALCHAVT